MMLTMLHLSDLHFGPEHYWGKPGQQDLADAIAGILNKCKPLDLLILSGDLTGEGSLDHYFLVDTFLDKLLQHNRLQKVQDILCVPGNHDFPFTDPYRKEIKQQAEREVHYRTFLTNHLSLLKEKHKIKMGDIPWIDENRKKEMGEHLINLACFYKNLESSVDKVCYLFIALNSMKVDSKKHAGIGSFGIKQLDLIKKIVGSCRDNHPEHEVIPITICHHHLVPVSLVDTDYHSKKPPHSSITLDARYALKIFEEIGCSLVFHGHMHQPSCVSWRDRIGQNQRTINIVGAGSAGAKKDDLGDIAHHHFFVHTISKNSLVAESYTTSRFPFRFTYDEQLSTSLSWPPFGRGSKDECVLAHIEPKGSMKIAKETAIDDSDLYFMFLNVIDCKKTRRLIKEFADNYGKVKICAMYDLYGRYDTVIKYRDLEPRGKRFSSELWKYLNSSLVNQIREDISDHTLDITNELYKLEDNDQITSFIILPDNDVYENALWTCAFIEILLQIKMEVNDFINQLIFKLKNEFEGKLINIIKGVYIGHDKSILLELRMSCNQFHYMNKLSSIIETIIDKKGIDKYTHIAYYHDEYST